MRKVEQLEAAAIVKRTMSTLLATVGGKQLTRDAADLRRAVGDINAFAALYLTTGTLAAKLIKAFGLATKSGAGFDAYDRLRRQLIAEKPVFLPGILVALMSIHLTLAQMSRIIAATQYVSRLDADVVLGRINAAFEPAEEDAADLYDAGTYQALVALHGALTRDLVDRSMLLPRVIPFDVAGSLPALALAARLYPDDMRKQDRSTELWKENKVVHPAFMPRQGVYLSA